MNCTLHQLKVFLKVVETRSITRAAEELCLTQPAVSIQIKNFQHQFDIPIIEMVGKQIHITDFGLEVAKIARKIIEDAEQLQYKTYAYKGLLAGKLKISVVSTGKYIIPYYLADFSKIYPNIELIIDVTNRAKLLENLEKHLVDIGLVAVPVQELKVQEMKLLQNKLYLMANADMPDVTPTMDFSKVIWIYREWGSANRKFMEDFLLHNNIKVSRKIELTSNEAVKQAVIAGLGYSVMPFIGSHNEIKSGILKTIPFQGLPIITDWRLIWLDKRETPPVVNAFLEYVSLYKQKIYNTYFSQFID
ncbi:MAG: LysR family transcriptional regulator [Bacteroidia bacterium]|nr:LysR family transcriptional regulator [Bacteroidia bacterium]MDW8348259.1 LysR family transcriptional regulator [Bacteroidia bacterium]